jgi:heterodisulfide reductase subunit C
MKLATTQKDMESGFRAEVEKLAGTRIADCYQCGKCSAGCPICPEMRHTPSQIMRLIQLGLRDEALSSPTIWLCASCQTCTTRCPKEVDIAAVMDACRQMAVQEGRSSPNDSDITAFHHAFLRMIKKYGRLYEFRLVGEYKMNTLHFFQDATVAPIMFLKGKLKLLPDKIKGVKAVRKIFEKCRV